MQKKQIQLFGAHGNGPNIDFSIPGEKEWCKCLGVSPAQVPSDCKTSIVTRWAKLSLLRRKADRCISITLMLSWYSESHFVPVLFDSSDRFFERQSKGTPLCGGKITKHSYSPEAHWHFAYRNFLLWSLNLHNTHSWKVKFQMPFADLRDDFNKVKTSKLPPHCPWVCSTELLEGIIFLKD